MIPQRPRGRLIHAEEAIGCIPGVDNLCRGQTSDAPRTQKHKHDGTVAGTLTPHHIHNKEEEDLDMYGDAEEATDGQFEDAAGDAVTVLPTICAAPKVAENVPYRVLPMPTATLPPPTLSPPLAPPLPFATSMPSTEPPAKRLKTAAVSFTGPTPVPRKQAPTAFNSFATGKEELTMEARRVSADKTTWKAPFPAAQAAANRMYSHYRAGGLNSLNSAAKVVEANSGSHDGYKLCCNDVVLRRGSRARRHPGNVFFQKLISIKREAYQKATPNKQNEIACFVISIVEHLKPKGNFLKKTKQGNWMEANASTAMEVTHQLFRNDFTLAEVDATNNLKPNNPLKTQDGHPKNQEMRPPMQPVNNQGYAHLQAAAAAEQARTAAVMANFPMGMPGVFPTMNPFAVFVPPYPMPGSLPMAQYETARAAYFGGSMGALAATNMQATQFLMAQQQQQQQAAMATDSTVPMPITSQQSILNENGPKDEGENIHGKPFFQGQVEKKSEDNQASNVAPEEIISS